MMENVFVTLVGPEKIAKYLHVRKIVMVSLNISFFKVMVFAWINTFVIAMKDIEDNIVMKNLF
jgi:hypothetical protein